MRYVPGFLASAAHSHWYPKPRRPHSRRTDHHIPQLPIVESRLQAGSESTGRTRRSPDIDHPKIASVSVRVASMI